MRRRRAWLRSLLARAMPISLAMLCACSAFSLQKHTIVERSSRFDLPLVNATLSWPKHRLLDALAGGDFVNGGGAARSDVRAIARAELADNPRIDAVFAVYLAIVTERAARRNALPPLFLAATLLQESAYNPYALSSSGAIGIGQFMPGTAAMLGLDPFDPYASIAASARLIGGYVASYRNAPGGALHGTPFALALAAYNAGPGAVSAYRGVPPYAETVQYIALIRYRWDNMRAYEGLGRILLRL
ncbi:MAG: lytic transglycosylase domain-containing protein [Candidatus Eremiobacteraeota bacterium]|nr:lytic transglycosylase domain-containing protein [Candidatus Eremiobacteraeota bacterium]